MPAAFVDEWRIVHVTVTNTRGEVAEEARAVEGMTPSQRRMWETKKEMERELGFKSAQR